MKLKKIETKTTASVLSIDTEARIRELLLSGYPLKPWSLEAAESYGLFMADPQPTDADIDRIAAELRRTKRSGN